MYQNLRVSRQEKKKTQSEIAELLHITKQQYQLYESGKREMPMHHFMVLARFYNVSLDYLAGLIDEPKALYCP
ncbi:MAG: helix-turn-helix transcriptional regulator [Eubacteriales bacterium]|nr:helix-turn-helix transcriptional regulator [Eubacteriales bacterium]